MKHPVNLTASRAFLPPQKDTDKLYLCAWVMGEGVQYIHPCTESRFCSHEPQGSILPPTYVEFRVGNSQNRICPLCNVALQSQSM